MSSLRLRSASFLVSGALVLAACTSASPDGSPAQDALAAAGSTAGGASGGGGPNAAGGSAAGANTGGSSGTSAGGSSGTSAGGANAGGASAGGAGGAEDDAKGGAAGATAPPATCPPQWGACQGCGGVSCKPGTVIEYGCNISGGPAEIRCTCNANGAYACGSNCHPAPATSLAGTGLSAVAGYAVEGEWAVSLMMCSPGVALGTVTPEGAFLLEWASAPSPKWSKAPLLRFTRAGLPPATCKIQNPTPGTTTTLTPETCPLLFEAENTP